MLGCGVLGEFLGRVLVIFWCLGVVLGTFLVGVLGGIVVVV